MIATTDYTVFPVLYVDGVYQHDSTWTQLTRTLCGIAAGRGVAVDACMPISIDLSITFDGEVRQQAAGSRQQTAADALIPSPHVLCIPSPTHQPKVTPSDVNAVEAAVLSAVNLAASNASLPVRFDTDDHALTQPGEVSYVDVNATFSVEMLPSKHPALRKEGGEYLFKATLLEVRPNAALSLSTPKCEPDQTHRLRFSLGQPCTPPPKGLRASHGGLRQ